MAGVKGALKLRGMDLGDLRSPLESLDEESLKELERRLKELELL